MVHEDDLTACSYPDPASMPAKTRIVAPAYRAEPGASVAPPDFSRFFPPPAPGAATMAATVDNDGLKRLEALQTSGLSELELARVREKLNDGFSRVVDEVFASLSADARPAAAPSPSPAPAPAPAPHQEMDLRSLMAASRRGETLTRNGRELAEDIVIGSLVNWGNEVWDPNDPSTNSPAEKNFLLALLRQ